MKDFINIPSLISKEKEIKQGQRKLKEILTGKKYDENLGTFIYLSKGIDAIKYNFGENLKKLTNLYKENISDNIVIETKNSIDMLKTKANELLNFAKNTKYLNDVFKFYIQNKKQNGLAAEIKIITEFKNNINDIKNEALKTISKYSEKSTKNLKTKLEKETDRIINLCNKTISYFINFSKKYNSYTSMKKLIFDLIKTNYKLVKLGKK